jgi:hypothetical protein
MRLISGTRLVTAMALGISLFSLGWAAAAQVELEGRYYVDRSAENLLILVDTETGKVWKSWPCNWDAQEKYLPENWEKRRWLTDNCWVEMQGGPAGAAEPTEAEPQAAQCPHGDHKAKDCPCGKGHAHGEKSGKSSAGH